MTWYVDRTRYHLGFSCPWRRLLAFHANYTGLSPKIPNVAQTTGILIHEALGNFLLDPSAPHPSIPAIIDHPGTQSWESATQERAQDEVTACVWGWYRTTYPYYQQHFDTVAVETEYNLDLPHPDLSIRWMARPDLVARSKSTGKLSIHDWKSVSSWRDDYLRDWADSLQMMMNAHAASLTLGVPITQYYVHFLVRGSADWPTPLTHAYYKSANPPLEPEDWKLKKVYGRSGQFYDKIPVSSRRPLPEWIDSLPPEVLSKHFIMGGPFQVNPYKVRLFTEGLLSNEFHWRESLNAASDAALSELGKNWSDPAALNDPHFRLLYSSFFPRTFNCYTYNSRCSFYDLCLKPETKWQDSYEPRKPHHSQEEI